MSLSCLWGCCIEQSCWQGLSLLGHVLCPGTVNPNACKDGEGFAAFAWE